MKRLIASVLSIILAAALATIGSASYSNDLASGCEISTGGPAMDWVNDGSAHPWAASASPQVTTDWSLDEKKLSVRFRNIYPGAVVSFGGWLFNSGEMRARFSGVNLAINSDRNRLADYLFVVPEGTSIGWASRGDARNSSTGLVQPVPAAYTNLKLRYLGDAISGRRVPGYPGLKAATGVTLNPASHGSDWRYAGRFALGDASNPKDPRGITLRMSPDAPNAVQGATLRFTMQFNFTQDW